MRWKTIMMLWMLAVLAMLGSGCKENVPETALDKFINRTAALEGQALTDTLQALARGAAPFNAYANYLLGNRQYEAASDSARSMGWSDPGVNALLDSAEVYFNAAVAQDSTFLEPMVNLGSLWDDRAEQMGSREERDMRLANAKKFYEMALAVDPADEKARCNLGSLYLRQRRVKEAMNEFMTALEYDQRSALAHYNLAIMFAEQKIYREAIVEWELASKYDADGDIGERSRDNIEIVKDLMNAPTPGAVQ
jgi:tetratricopeptide (TPR) repeat protein